MSSRVQTDFAHALLARDRSVPAGVTTGDGSGPGHRFAVHRSNIAAGLIAALASRFPAAERIVGTAFFAAMAHAYIDAHPPRSPVLMTYGNDLAAFVERFAPAAGVPYLADVIRLEAARGRAYHAADVAPLDPAALGALSPEQLGTRTFALHPAASIIQSHHPVVRIWAMNTGEVEPKPIRDWVGQDALVTRPRLTVEVRSLPIGGGAFVAALAAGLTLGAAADDASQQAPEFDLAVNLAGMLQAGVMAAIL